jgi:hypothetical protein
MTSVSLRGIAAFALCVAAGARTPARGDAIFFADIFNPDPTFGSIRSVGLNGQTFDTLRETGGGLRAMAVDGVNGKMYWVDADAPAIRRANLNGSNVETIVTDNLLFPSAIAVDPAGGKIYWGDQLRSELRRANLDGSSQQLLRSTAFHRGIALDIPNGKVYWSTSDTFLKGEIMRCNFNGTAPETVVTSNDAEFKPSAIALDLKHQKVYWTDYVVDVVRWANLDGTGIQTLFFVGANLNPRGIAVDPVAGKVYWGQDVDFKLPVGEIRIMELDGALPDTFATGLGLVNYIAIVPGVNVCPADIAPIAGDGEVNIDDLLAVISAWGPCIDPLDCPADTAPAVGDDEVNIDDLLAVISAWGVCGGG